MATTTRKPRELSEAYASAASDGPALVVDREAGVIRGVKVLGRYSRNRHLAEAENGTEYTPAAMREALPLYEGADVLTDHPKDRSSAGLRAERSVSEVFGQLRNCRVEDDAIKADLHFLKSHPMANAVCEDVERRLGVYGLSHNAAAGKERFDRGAGRLVVESIAVVRSVDLVRKPATNRNLWESTVTTPAKTTTLREVLESRRPKLPKGKKKWTDRLLEDDGMGYAVDAPVPEEVSAEPDDALWAGFESAIMAVLGKYESGEADAAGVMAKIKQLLTTHEKLAADADSSPDDVAEEEEDDDAEGKGKAESQSSAELDRLRRKDRVRDLCEAEGFAPSKTALAALMALGTDAERRTLIGEFQSAAGGKEKPGVKPRSVAAGSGRSLTESRADDKPPPAAARLNALRDTR